MNTDELVGKTIKKIDVDGYGILMETEDGIVLSYDASDGGYSSYCVVQKGSLPRCKKCQRPECNPDYSCR